MTPADVAAAAPSASLRVVGGLGPDGRGAVAISGRDASRPGAGNVSLVVGPGDPVGERRRLLQALGCPPDRGVFMAQVHGGRSAVVDASHAGRGLHDHADAIAEVDALVTTAHDVPLVVMVADCVPVALLGDGGVAVAHAGRRGVAADVLGDAVARLRSAAAPEDISAVIGPAIGGCCYEVSEDVARQVTRDHPAAAATTTWGTPSLDLPAAVASRLRALGVTDITRIGACTRHAPGWFSHRGDPEGGRQAMAVVRRGAPAAQADPGFLDSVS